MDNKLNFLPFGGYGKPPYKEAAKKAALQRGV
jgi:hypothetical protein